MSDRPKFQYQRVLTLSLKAFNILKDRLGEIKTAHPDMPYFFFRKQARAVTIYGQTQTETIKFSFIVFKFLRENGISPSEIQMSDPVPIPQGAPMGGAGAPAPNANVARLPLFAPAAAAAAAPAPRPITIAANGNVNVRGETLLLGNAVETNVGGVAIPGLSGGNRRKRRSTRKSRKSTQSRKARRSRRA